MNNQSKTVRFNISNERQASNLFKTDPLLISTEKMRSATGFEDGLNQLIQQYISHVNDTPTSRALPEN